MRFPSCPISSSVSQCLGWLAAATALGCEPVGAPVTPSATAPDAPSAPDIQVITEGQAARAGMSAVALSVPFDENTNGAAMLDAWLDAARGRGSRRVGDITMYVVRPREQGAVECRQTFYPEDSVVPTLTPPRSEPVSITRPVTRSVTHYEQRCRMVTKPVTQSVTTYQSQYDAFSKTYRTVPQTKMVTKYESRNECRSEPVTRMETHWEFATEWRYVPPRTEYLVRKRLRETEPVCYVAEEGATSRVEGKVYLPAD